MRYASRPARAATSFRYSTVACSSCVQQVCTACFWNTAYGESGRRQQLLQLPAEGAHALLDVDVVVQQPVVHALLQQQKLLVAQLAQRLVAQALRVTPPSDTHVQPVQRVAAVDLLHALLRRSLRTVAAS